MMHIYMAHSIFSQYLRNLKIYLYLNVRPTIRDLHFYMQHANTYNIFFIKTKLACGAVTTSDSTFICKKSSLEQYMHLL